MIEQKKKIILKKLQSEKEILNSVQLAEELKIDHNDLDGLLKSLLASKKVELINNKYSEILILDKGKKYIEQSPEQMLLKLIKQDGLQLKNLKENYNEIYQQGFSQCMKNKYINIKNNIIYREDKKFQHEIKFLLQKHLNGQKLSNYQINLLKKRKLIEIRNKVSYQIIKGEQFDQHKQTVAELTSQMFQDNKWMNYDFKQYNLQAKGLEIGNGSLHPLMKVKNEFRQIFLQMGFQQMKTDQYVQSSFWNFDSLFQPQKHPARDAHDTFFVQNKLCQIDQPQYWQRIKNIHQNGGFGSKGYGYQWLQGQARKNILRTHTTAISSKTLYNLAKNKQFQPRKFFSIDRVFRNQSIDKTHLSEFHQVQGFVMDRNLGLGHLMGVINQFFEKIGIKNIQFKPTYNPYTQPSMQIFGKHPQLGKRIQIGNSGIFRPQMLKPMGFPDDIKIIAWGLSLQRPTMIKYNINHITDLFGYSSNINWLKKSPIAYFHH